LADAGYDSNIIKNKLKNIKNKRNIKDKQKLQAIKLLKKNVLKLNIQMHY